MEMIVVIRVEMSEETFSLIPYELREEMQIKRIEAINYTEVYKQSSEWNEANKELGKAIKKRSEIEDEIRSNDKQ